MNRQIDVRALVSHIVSGDGMDRCRICMGDTTEGQVFLSDTVMLDDDRPITLSELLETVTGVEVGVQELLPGAVCSDCVGATMRAAQFQDFCRESISVWHRNLSSLRNIPQTETLRKGTKGVFIIMQSCGVQVVNDQTGGLQNKKEACERLQTRLCQIKYGSYRNEWIRKEKRCKCPDCGKQFFYAYHLYNHLSQADVDSRACPFCAEVMSRDALVDHLTTTHDRTPYPCEICPAILKSEEGLANHNNKCHPSEGTPCYNCGRAFPSEKALQAHVLKHGEKVCPGCMLCFRNHSCYIFHTNNCQALPKDVTKKRNTIKSSEQQCFCDICKKRFSNKKCLTAHIQHVHLKSMLRTCPHCPKTMPSAYLNQHLKSHQIVKDFVCNHCGISLKSRLGYIQHLRLHTGEKPYPCKICSETFSTSSRRSEHIQRKHRSMDETFLRHKCPYCPAKFRLPYRLKGHIATVHKFGKWNKGEINVGYQCNVCHALFVSYKSLVLHCKKYDHMNVAKTTEQQAMS